MDQSSSVVAVPYFVLELDGGKAKAIYTIPVSAAESVISNPILCCGACFQLIIDTTSQQHEGEIDTSDNNSPSCHISTEYFSPKPHETAYEISRRLAIRVGESSSGASTFLASLLC